MGYTESVVLIEEQPKAERPTLCSPNVSKGILEKFNQYISHTTRAHALGDKVYIITEVKFKREETEDITSASARLLEARQAAGVHELGSGPSQKCMPALQYRLVHKSEGICLGGTAKPVHGECMFLLEEGQTRYTGLSSCIPTLNYMNDTILNSYKQDNLLVILIAKFKSPQWFTQRKNHNIVVPGIPFKSFSQLHLTLKGPNPLTINKWASRFRVINVKVDLQELTTWGSEEPFESSSKELRHRTLSDLPCSEWLWTPNSNSFTSHESVTLEAPEKLFDYDFPNVEPTFFYNNLLRQYALKFTLTLKNEESKEDFNLSTLLEINVAKQATLFESLTQKLPSIEPTFRDTRMRCFTSFKKYVPNNFVPKDVCKALFDRILGSPTNTYCFHRTAIFSTGNFKYAVTELFVRLETNSELLNEILPVVNAIPFRWKKGALIVCELAPPARSLVHQSKRVAGTYFRCDGHRFKYDFEPLSIISGPQSFDSVICKVPFVFNLGTRRSLRNLGLTFKTIYTGHTRFEHEESSRTVAAGIPVPDFLKLLFRIPYEKATRAKPWKNTIARLTKVTVSVESFCYEDEDYVNLNRKETIVLRKELDLRLLFKKFEQKDGYIEYCVPRSNYDCVMPGLAPSIIQEGVNVSYNICTQFDIEGVGWKDCIAACIPIQIATESHAILDGPVALVGS